MLCGEAGKVEPEIAAAYNLRFVGYYPDSNEVWRFTQKLFNPDSKIALPDTPEIAAALNDFEAKRYSAA